MRKKPLFFENCKHEETHLFSYVMSIVHFCHYSATYKDTTL